MYTRIYRDTQMDAENGDDNLSSLASILYHYHNCVEYRIAP
jgi:hypothetical protein